MEPPEPESTDRRWPRKLYGAGSEPDARFTLANERTFLAWLRTALALMAAGVGIEALTAATDSAGPHPLRTSLAVALLLAGVLCSIGAFVRWLGTELALRTGRPLPSPRLAPLLGIGLAVVGLATCVLLLVDGI